LWGKELIMIDMHEMRKRASGGIPPTALPAPLGETQDAKTSREIVNHWIREWEKDKRLLGLALDEIDRLRHDVTLLQQATDSNLFQRLIKISQAREALNVEEKVFMSLLHDLNARGLVGKDLEEFVPGITSKIG
jgi:hypothetical protein